MDKLGELVLALNQEFVRLHREGESVKIGANGYYFKLQNNELVVFEAEVNRCRHRWILCRGPVDIEEGGDEFDFQMCKKCGMTRKLK